MSNPGGGDHAEAQHVHPGAGQAGHHSGLEKLAGCPRIPAHDGD